MTAASGAEMRMRNTGVTFAILATMLLCVQGAWAELKILDRPLWVFPGQPFRIALEQPAGSGELRCEFPGSIEMYDQWDQDAIQRYYFRALDTGNIALRFSGAGGELEVPIEIIPWSSVFEPRQYENVELPRIWPVGETDFDELKTRRTLHSEAEVAALRASGEKPGGIAQAWLEMSDDEVFDIIPGPAIPRTCLIVLSIEPDRGKGKGCPVCGTAIYEGRDGFYPWKFDPVEHPWKVGCPNCGTWFPSNDWHEGDMHSGPFPDDGFGCEPADPVPSPGGTPWRWPFIAYYHQWQAYMKTLTPGVDQCVRAWLSTGDDRYAHKCLVALLRFAESHLDMTLNLNHRKLANRDGVYRGPVGAPIPSYFTRLARSFSYIQPNWDTSRMEASARAWDLLFDRVEGDEELLAFCRSRHHPEIQTADDFRRFMDAGIMRTCAQYGMDNAVSRNWPQQEAMIATMGVALGTPRTLEIADWLLNGPGGLRYALTNYFFKDGAGHEAGGYNGGQVIHTNQVISTLDRFADIHPEQYRPPRFITLSTDPKYRLMYDFPIENLLIGRSSPATGDSGFKSGTGPLAPRTSYPLAAPDFLDIFRRTLDPRFAQAIWGPEGSIPDGLVEPDLRERVEQIGRELGWQVDLPTRVLDGYGHAILRSGEGYHQRALWMRYGRTLQHRHQDLLSFGLEALSRKLLPELGYPVGWSYAGDWEANWGTHYGAHITGVKQDSFRRASLELMCACAPAQVARASTATAGGERRERVIALIDVDETRCYAVSLERVSGGEEHWWSFHGPTGEATVSGVQLGPQGGGTVAGPEIAYRDTTAAAKALGDGALSCLSIMPNPSRGTIAGPWELDVPLKDQDGISLHVTNLAPGDGELATAVCTAPGGRSHYEAMWTVVHRRGEAPLTSEFLSVIEPVEGGRAIESVELLRTDGGGEPPFRPYALRVQGRGFTDTIIIQPQGGYACVTPRGMTTDAEFAFWRERDGRLDAAVMAGGTRLVWNDQGLVLGRAAYHGFIESCDWADRKVRVRLAEDDADSAQSLDVGLTARAELRQKQVDFVGMTEADASALVGRFVHIGSRPTPPAEPGQDATYRVETATPIEGGVELTLEIDPRLGEGTVAECQDGKLISDVFLRMYPWQYFAGRHLVNEDASAIYRLADVTGGKQCILDSAHAEVTAAKLAEEFGDRDGDGQARFTIYDYGPGDEVTIPCWASVRAAG